MKVGNKVLGLAVGQKSILVAEVTSKGGRVAVSHVGEFSFPEGVPLSAPDKMGRAFHAFLKTNHFSAKAAIVGLPAKRLVTRRKEVPPANAAVAAATLRLQAETEFSSELDNLIMDFAGTPSTVEATTVLVVAANRVEVDELDAMAKVAGLKVYAVTSTTAALGRATSRLPGGDGLVLSLGPGGAELVVQHGSDPAHLKHLNVLGGNESLPALAGEIRRAMLSIPRNGTPQTLALWNATEVENPGSILEQRLAMPVTMPELGSLVATDAAGADRFAPAVALALAGIEDASTPPVDFLHSRLAPPKAPMVSRPKMIAMIVGVLFAAFAAYAYLDMGQYQDRLDSENAKLKNQDLDLKRANFELARMGAAQKWLPDGPRFVAVLRDLTVLFPTGQNTIWATGLENKENDAWELSGLTPDPQRAQDLVNTMHNTDRFKDAKLAAMVKQASGSGSGSQATQGPGLYKFKVDFRYDLKGSAQSAAQPTGRAQPTRGATRGRGTTPATASAKVVPTTAPAASAPAR